MKPDPNRFEEVTLRTEPIYDGRIISLQLEHVRLPNGKEATREIVKHPGAVAVLALLDGKLLVVEQYRKALGRNQIEIPAGKLDPGEDPMQTGLRELEEETGYTAAKLQHLTSFYTSPGFANEMLHLYAAEGLAKGELKLDEDEFLDCFTITLEEAAALIQEGRISDAKTITAVWAWKLYTLTGEYGL